MIDGMGDKAAAKETMAGVPTIPGSDGIIKDFEECKKLALRCCWLPCDVKSSCRGWKRNEVSLERR